MLPGRAFALDRVFSDRPDEALRPQLVRVPERRSGTDFQSVSVNLQDPDKIYAVVVESGNSVACGVGGREGISAIYLHTCGGVEWQFVLGHEIFHSLGAVNPCASHYSGDGHVTGDPNDLMDPYARASGSPNLDTGHDDYWGPVGDDHLPTACPATANVVNSPFLTSHPYYRVSIAVNGSGQVYGLTAVPCSRGTYFLRLVREGLVRRSVPLRADVADPGRACETRSVRPLERGVPRHGADVHDQADRGAHRCRGIRSLNRSTSSRTQQVARWSLTMPHACMDE